MGDTMEGVEFQIRNSHPQQFTLQTYPLSLDTRLAQGDTFQAAEQTLRNSLQSAVNFFSSPEAPPHTQAPCQRCTQRRHAILSAYHAFYVSFNPSSWTYPLTEYKYEIDRQLRSEENFDIDKIQKLYYQKLREHLKSDLCSELGETDKEIYIRMFDDESMPLPQILSIFLHEAINKSPDSSQAQFLAQLQGTKTKEERAQIYINYYCPPSPTDTPQQRQFKSKYRQEFESLLPHDTVLQNMKSEAAQARKSKVEGFERELNSLQMAQSAHQKNQKKKEEIRVDRLKEEELKLKMEPLIEKCWLRGCERELDLNLETVVECAVCEWVGRRVRRRNMGRIVYCSGEHAKEDFEEHDHIEHRCCMGNHCLYYPSLGPESENITGGLCQNCVKLGVVSFFCSQKCYARNLEAHRDDFHAQRGIPSDIDLLEIFKTGGMDILN